MVKKMKKGRKSASKKKVRRRSTRSVTMAVAPMPMMSMQSQANKNEGWSLTLVLLGVLFLVGIIMVILWATGVFEKDKETGKDGGRNGGGTASPSPAPSGGSPPPTQQPPAGGGGGGGEKKEDDESKGLEGGQIAGIIVGSILGLALLAGVAWILSNRDRREMAYDASKVAGDAISRRAKGAWNRMRGRGRVNGDSVEEIEMVDLSGRG